MIQNQGTVQLSQVIPTSEHVQNTTR